jgi:hypothetical protein
MLTLQPLVWTHRKAPGSPLKSRAEGGERGKIIAAPLASRKYAVARGKVLVRRHRTVRKSREHPTEGPLQQKWSSPSSWLAPHSFPPWRAISQPPDLRCTGVSLGAFHEFTRPGNGGLPDIGGSPCPDSSRFDGTPRFTPGKRPRRARCAAGLRCSRCFTTEHSPYST